MKTTAILELRGETPNQGGITPTRQPLGLRQASAAFESRCARKAAQDCRSPKHRTQSRAGFQPARRALQRSRWFVAPTASARAGKMPALLSSSWKTITLGSAILLLHFSILRANPAGGTVSRGSASFATSGSQLTINTSDHAFINWQSFNIGLGETTTFVQPSSSSVVWNRINDSNPSQILGNLNANGYVVLQNEFGFYVGGQASINTHGLLMTTAPVRAPDVFSSGAWQFDAPPPTAKIINYGKINGDGSAPVFLIGGDLENNGTIENPGGRIGLYAGRKVLVSTSPDGRGISAEVTLPQGSVDNQGRLIADGGSIALQAKVVNQAGLIQANSVREVNGTIELVASDSVNLGTDSRISARGDVQGISSGGTVTVKAGNHFSDQSGSTMDVTGGAQGGNGGQLEISATQMGPIQSSIQSRANPGFAGGKLTIDPYDIVLDYSYISSLNNQIAGGLSEINLEADHNIELSTSWNLAALDAAGTLSLSAGNNITLDNFTHLAAGKNWSVNMKADTSMASDAEPVPGQAGIYLNGSAYLQTQDGSINLWAANEVQVGWTGPTGERGAANTGSGRVTTIGGGAIKVTAERGDVNTGSGTAGFNYIKAAPYYTPFAVINPSSGAIDPTRTSLGGIRYRLREET